MNHFLYLQKTLSLSSTSQPPFLKLLTTIVKDISYQFCIRAKDPNKMRALEEQSRRTNEEIQEVRAEVKMQGTELYNKIEQLQLKMETLLSTMSSFEASQDSEREMRENVVGIQESNRGGYNINYPTLWGKILVVG